MTPYGRCSLLKYSTLGSVRRTRIILPVPKFNCINSSNEVDKILTYESRKKVEKESIIIIDVWMSDLECILDVRISIGLHKYLRNMKLKSYNFMVINISTKGYIDGHSIIQCKSCE